MGKHIIIKEARCSFPRLYSGEVRDGDTFGPGIALILEPDNHAAVLAEIKAAMVEAINSDPKLKANKPTGDRICLRKPDRDELKYKEGNLVIKANCPRPPMVLEPDGRTVMTAATDKIYSGCYVNAKIEIWGQNNKWGKRVNAKLIAVQYVPKPADSFDGSYVSPEEAASGFGSLDGTLTEDNVTGFGDDNDGLLGNDNDDLLS